jgi:hypothetical protein
MAPNFSQCVATFGSSWSERPLYGIPQSPRALVADGFGELPALHYSIAALLRDLIRMVRSSVPVYGRAVNRQSWVLGVLVSRSQASAVR